ncbi:uncharacterized protein [Miscanthus floridulus]|uniref:uncharacterized protein n=1 Tax=Miscanthus floridulus TaxID=154761 RepID=UPI0034597D30
MAGSYAAVPFSTPLGAHPWATPALFSAAPPAGSYAAVPFSTPLGAHPWAAPALFSAAPPAGSYAAMPISTPLATHPWAALALFSAAPPALSSAAPPVFTTATATVAPLPAQQPPPSTGAFGEWMATFDHLQRQMDVLATLVHNIEAQPASVPSSSPTLLSTSPSLIPSFTTPSPVPPQQDSDGVFYGGVDGIQTSAAQLQAVAHCLLARRQGRQHPIFKRRRPVVPTAAALQLTERKAIARASACKVFAAVRLQAAARGLLARRRLQKMRSPMHEATLAAVNLSIGERDLAWSVDLAWSDGHQQPRQPAVVFRRKHGVFSVGGELQLCGTGDMGAASLLVTGGDALPSAIAFRHRPPRARLRWLLLPPILGGHTRAPLSFRWSPWDPGGYTRAGPASGGCPPYFQESKIKSRSLL